MSGAAAGQILQRTARDRSAAYQQFAAAFRYPDAEPRGTPGGGLGAEYNDLFEPAVSETACSLHEEAYAGEDRSVLFEELTRFYDHFGLARQPTAELPDHLSVELEFMHVLAFLEKERAGNPAEVTSLRHAQRDFLSRHVLRVAKALSARLGALDSYYGDLVRALGEFVEQDAQELADA